MSEIVPPIEETPGQHCARWLKSAKAKAQETNTVLTWVEVAKIIDSTLSGLKYFDHVKAPQRPSKAQNSEFGDRKAIPPTPEQVTAYSASIGAKIDASNFCDFYESKGWVVGKSKMKDWQAACRQWGRRDGRQGKSNTQNRDYTKI